MSVPVQFTVGNFQTGYCWPGPQQFALDLLGPSGIVTATIPGSGVPVIVQAGAPAPQYQGVALWAKLVSGFLEGTYWYNGGWFRPHPVPPNSQSRLIWMGTEAALWAYDGGDGTNPSVTAPTQTTGAMWQRDTAFGADDGSSIFKVPIGIGVNPTAYNGNPATTLAVGATGGAEKIQLAVSELPSHTHGNHAKLVQHGTADTRVYSDATEDAQPDQVTLDITGVTNPNNYHQNMPPYIGVIFARRTARQFIQG